MSNAGVPSPAAISLGNATFEARHATAQTGLLALLQADSTGKTLERLAASLIGDLADVPVVIAASGFQYGGDAGPAGHSGRRFRIETKKYGESTALNQRELLGEIDQALSRDPALEAWILVATKPVSEQLRQSLVQKGEKEGLPVLILPWEDDGLATLAALCASSPSAVEREVSGQAAAHARTLAEVAGPSVETLRRDVSSWAPGYEMLRRRAEEKLEAIWSSSRESRAELGQDAAVGARVHRVSRGPATAQFEGWWAGRAREDAPLAVIGLEGVGKTWAVIDWLHRRLSAETVVLTLSSAAAAGVSKVSTTDAKRLIAERLQLVTNVRDVAHWTRRLDFLLKRPLEEGPVLTLFLDGVNQEASAAWTDLLKVLQGSAFEGRVRVVLSTREHHFKTKLRALKGLDVGPVVARLEDFDLSPGGEFDQMLAFEGLTRDALGEELVERARNPRLFGLVVRLKDKLSGGGQVTLHRLLWEYGRDSLGVRSERSFSEEDWREWLRELAGLWHKGEPPQSTRELGATLARADLGYEDVAARLSDIIDGRFASATGDGVEVSPVIVSHALGLALLDRLSKQSSASADALDADLNSWLDPISGLDQRSEILRAAVSIGLERDEPVPSSVLGVLVTAWLQGQNVTDLHRMELAGLSPQLVGPLLDAAERSDGVSLRSARLWAVNALRQAPSTPGVNSEIVRRCAEWFDDIPLNPDRINQQEFVQKRLEQLRDRIGRDQAGSAVILSRTVRLTDANDTRTSMVPSLMEGRPLAEAMDVFEAAAVNLAVARRCDAVDGLAWLVQLNEVDPDETRRMLRTRAADLVGRAPEDGVNPQLAGRAASNLLRLSGAEVDDLEAERIDTDLGREWSYETAYLESPGESLFELERRHSEGVLADQTLPFHRKLSKSQRFWIDPDFKAPEAFHAELAVAASNVDPSALNRHSSVTPQDVNFEELAPALAREHPALLADLGRRKLLAVGAANADERVWAAIGLRDEIVLHDSETAEAVRALRLANRLADEGREAHASCIMLSFELQGLDAFEQASRLLEAGLKYILVELSEVLQPLSVDEIDRLFALYGTGTSEQKADLLVIISITADAVSDSVWQWIESRAETLEENERGFAFQVLALLDARRWGERLQAQGWRWEPTDHVWANHWGSLALVEATKAVTFEALVERLAPWRLGAAVVQRGSDPAEAELAAEILTQVIRRDGPAPDLGAQVTVEVNERGEHAPVTVSLDEDEEGVSGAEALRRAFDPVARLDALNRAARIARDRIKEAQSSGASLYLTEIKAADLVPIVRAAPSAVRGWLEGMEDGSPDFRRRVHLAESTYLALCEALLTVRPAEGAALWRLLKTTLNTRWLGRGAVEELLHIPFRTPPSPELNAIHDDLRSLSVTATDNAVYDLVFAAEYNGRADWVDAWRDKDAVSGVPWRELRAIVIDGARAVVNLPVANVWEEGPPGTRLESLRRTAAASRLRSGAARHWWRSFQSATSGLQAYAAWWMYLDSTSSADSVWLRDPANQFNIETPLFRAKLSQVTLGTQAVKRRHDKLRDKRKDKFLGRSIWKGLGPWTHA